MAHDHSFARREPLGESDARVTEFYGNSFGRLSINDRLRVIRGRLSYWQDGVWDGKTSTTIEISKGLDISEKAQRDRIICLSSTVKVISRKFIFELSRDQIFYKKGSGSRHPRWGNLRTTASCRQKNSRLAAASLAADTIFRKSRVKPASPLRFSHDTGGM